MNGTGWVAADDICRPLIWAEVFGNDHPVEIDLGAGDGSFVGAYAARHPERNFLATERLLGRARKIAKKAARRGLANLKVLRLESDYTLQYLVPPASVAVIHLMFPDPWPKRRHWPNRIVQGPFVVHVAQALQAAGEFRWTTDHEEYFQGHRRFFDESSLFRPAAAWDLADYPVTDFEADFAKEGRATYRGRWVKV